MKVAMIGQKGIPSRAGGVEVHVEEISKRLVKLGCKVEVYCRKEYCEVIPADNIYQGISIKHAFHIRSKHLDAITHTFFSTIKALFSGCDLFHYHALGPSTLSFIPRLFGRKVVCTVHGLDWQRSKWSRAAAAFLKFGEYASARFSHKVIHVSENLAQYYKNKYHIEPVYIPNGVNKPETAEANIIRHKYGLTKNGYLLFLARLVPEKGAHYLIKAFKQLNTDKKLVIAGGSGYCGKYEKELLELAEGNKNIIFTGFVSGRELAELYSNAYVYILPSDVEGLPISLLEAMSFGCCCLTSSIPENAQVIGNKGYIFEKSNVDDLAVKLDHLLCNPEEVAKAGRNAVSYVLNKYNWDDASLKTYCIYQELVSRTS